MLENYNKLWIEELNFLKNSEDYDADDYDYYEQFYESIKTEKYHTTVPMTTVQSQDLEGAWSFVVFFRKKKLKFRKKK